MPANVSQASTRICGREEMMFSFNGRSCEQTFNSVSSFSISWLISNDFQSQEEAGIAAEKLSEWNACGAQPRNSFH